MSPYHSFQKSPESLLRNVQLQPPTKNQFTEVGAIASKNSNDTLPVTILLFGQRHFKQHVFVSARFELRFVPFLSCFSFSCLKRRGRAYSLVIGNNFLGKSLIQGVFS